MKTQTATICHVYCRASTTTQDIGAQLGACEAVLRKLGYRLGTVYHETCSAFKSGTNQKALLKLLNSIRPGEYIAIRDASRFSRDVVNARKFLKDFKGAGIITCSDILPQNERYTYKTPEELRAGPRTYLPADFEDFYRQISKAQQFSEDLQLNSKMLYDTRVRRSNEVPGSRPAIGRPPYGYRPNETRDLFLEDPREQRIIDIIRCMNSASNHKHTQDLLREVSGQKTREFVIYERITEQDYNSLAKNGKARVEKDESGFWSIHSDYPLDFDETPMAFEHPAFSIAQELNEWGITYRSGEPWTQERVQNILNRINREYDPSSRSAATGTDFEVVSDPEGEELKTLEEQIRALQKKKSALEKKRHK